MMMSQHLADLLSRMSLREDVKASADSVSWQAYREAETLTDASLIGDLQAFVEVSRSKAERRSAYFILGTLGSNTGDVRCAEFLLTRVAAETDKYVLSVILESLAKLHLPRAMPIESILRLLQDPRWLVRHAAIQALRHAESGEAEEQLIGLLASTSDAFDKVYCHSTLGGIGTSRAIPTLTQSLTSRKRDVRMSAEFAIAAIQVRETNAPSAALPAHA